MCLLLFPENLDLDDVEPPLLHRRVDVRPAGESRGDGETEAPKARVAASGRGRTPVRGWVDGWVGEEVGDGVRKKTSSW